MSRGDIVPAYGNGVALSVRNHDGGERAIEVTGNQNSHERAGEAMHPLEQIERSLKHKLSLQLWQKEEEIMRQRVDRKEMRRSSTQNEIYQLFGLYFVFQGVVLTALFQAAPNNNPHTCRNWWLPLTLSLLASVATVAATTHKLVVQSQIEHELQQEKADSAALHKVVQDLCNKGTSVDLQNGPHSNSQPYILLHGLRAYTATVMTVLLTFTVITCLACHRLLCDTAPTYVSTLDPTSQP